MKAIVLENQRCRLRFDSANCRVELHDKQTGLILNGGLCEAEIMWNALQRFEIHKDLKLIRATKAADTQARFTFLAPWSRIEFEMIVTLAGGEFTVAIPWDSVREPRATSFRLFGVRPLPGLLVTTDTILAPLRTGALIHPARHPGGMSDQLLIYGQQSRWEDLPFLPVCAIFETGKSGVAVIAEEGDYDSQYEIQMDVAGAGTTGFSCRYRYHWPDPVDRIDRVLRYVLLDASSADYSGVGRRLNRFARETWKVSTLTEKCARSPAVDYIARAMAMKTFHAMKDLDHEGGDGEYHLFQTFAETKEQLSQLKAAGVEKAYLQLVGWNIDGHDGRYPTRFPVDDRLGGEAGFRELVRHGQSLGYQMQVHDNYVDSTNRTADFLIRNLWGDPLPRGLWAGGATCAINPLKLDAEQVNHDLFRLRELGVAGVVYLDAMSPPLEVDYDPQRGGPRRHHAEGVHWMLAQGRAVFGAAGTETGFAHVVRHADYIGDVPLRAVWEGLNVATPIQSLVDEWVPVWHLAFHGMLVHSTCDQPSPSVVKLLEAAETGGGARSDFSGANPDPQGSLFAIQWDARLLPAYKAKYDILVRLLGSNQCAFIEKHTRLGDQHYQTMFSNGRVVEVDYTAKRLVVDGKTIPIPPVFELNLPIRKQ